MNTNFCPCPSPSSIHVLISQPSKHFYITKQHGTIQVLKPSPSPQCTHPRELIIFVLKMFIQVSIGHCTERGHDKPHHNTLCIHQRGTRLKHKGLGIFHRQLNYPPNDYEVFSIMYHLHGLKANELMLAFEHVIPCLNMSIHYKGKLEVEKVCESGNN